MINGGHLETIVFNGCCTYDLCKALHDQSGVENLVCWSTKVEDEAAATFGSALAEAIVEKSPLAKAFEYAKSKVLGKSGPGHLDNGLASDVQKFAL